MVKKRILTMMSGGVDSSVCAALLVEQGYEVVGLTLRQYTLDASTLREKQTDPCTDIQDAKQVADRLGFAHHSLDTTDQFQTKVIAHFIESYRQGLTPNPCTHCNSFVKFEEANTYAEQFGCAFFATGHYAQLLQDEQGEWGLYRAVYQPKDQSYFLYGIRRELLPSIRFPLGSKRKEDVRAYAQKLGLSVATKPGSQDLCFAKDVDRYTDFLAQYIPPQEGAIVDRHGNRVGTHTGVVNYTVGQRRGIGLSGGPFYVSEINAKTNTVVVGTKEDLAQTRVFATETRWLADVQQGDRVKGQIRSRHVPSAATVIEVSENRVGIEYDEPQYGVAPGQALVLSMGEKIIGGGVILPRESSFA